MASPSPRYPNRPMLRHTASSPKHTACAFYPANSYYSHRQFKPPAQRFVGVADPIYNRADSRLNHKQGWDAPPVEASSVTLARLAGSGQEVRNSAKQSGLQNQQVLDGPQASAETLRKVLDSPPELLHFAVHVVSPPNRPQEAALALSLKKGGVPELLTPEAIATFRLPGTLVVLSGCSSSQGEPVPSAGLLGLSRAWLLAGAEAVIASSWPTPDDSGRFFRFFIAISCCNHRNAQSASVPRLGSDSSGIAARQRLYQLAFILGSLFNYFQGVSRRFMVATQPKLCPVPAQDGSQPQQQTKEASEKPRTNRIFTSGMGNSGFSD